MAQTELLKHAVDALDRLGIPSMLTGSLASSLQGQPRATHDIDLVIDLSPDRIDALLQAFPPPDFYLSRTAMEDAVHTCGMFNVLNLNDGDKIDFWMLTDESFDQSRFSRRVRYKVDGVDVAVSSPEDTILMKLKWSQAAGSSQIQYRDALNIYQLHLGALDIPYIEVWTRTLGLVHLWKRLQTESPPQ
jgi:hypothetical protein